MIPFNFQRGNKPAGCEDAPPVSKVNYSIVCDGLGGSGSTKHLVYEEDLTSTIERTSGYLGSRIVCSCVDDFYANNAEKMLMPLNSYNGTARINSFLEDLKSNVIKTLEHSMSLLSIEPSRSRTLKVFPTTLASALYCTYKDKVLVLAVWAGDSRIYILSPTKGLQLLSLDDARNADNEMNSTSEMTNCISAGNSFHLNYALYELDEPGIVFCCSDGCFDYLQSPLHFEWLLLHTILECMPDGNAEELGTILADCIRDNMYMSIGDDTTMAGIIVGIESTKQLKDLFQNRMSKSGNLAIKMNDCLKKLRTIQNERNTAQKNCRLFEGKIFDFVHSEVCMALQQKQPYSLLYSHLIAMPCFNEFKEQESDINRSIDEEYSVALQSLKEKSCQIEKVCRTMMICDYMKWQRIVNEPDGTVSSFRSPLPIIQLKSRGPSKSKHGYSNPAKLRQSILACIEVYKHPEFKYVTSPFMDPADDYEEYIRSQIMHLEEVLQLLNNTDKLFLDMWSQSYFSTDTFIKERQMYDRNTEFESWFKHVLQNPGRYEFLSQLTARKIAEFRKIGTELNMLPEKYTQEQEKRLNHITEEFWNRHKEEILDMILSKDETLLCSFFINATEPMNRILSYADARKTLNGIDSKIKNAQIEVDEIWNLYKNDYQLFKNIRKRGMI